MVTRRTVSVEQDTYNALMREKLRRLEQGDIDVTFSKIIQGALS